MSKKMKMKNVARIFTPVLLFSLIYLTGCYSDNEEDLYPNKSTCDTSNVTYTTTIAPIMQTNCNVCHSTAVASGGVVTDTYEGLKIPALNGKLWSAVSWTGPKKMPKDASQLSSCNLAKINIWIRDGAPNN